MYKQVTYWAKNYGAGGVPDQRAVQDFVECETTEVISTFRGELASIAQGKYDEATLDQLVGQKRKVLHNSYKEWAKLMLMWLASYHRGH